MKEREKLSPIALYGGAFLIVAMAIGALILFFAMAIDTAQQVFTHRESITFNKNVFYLLGSGIGLALLSVGGIYQSILGNTVTNRLAGTFTKAILGAVALAFILPHVVHYALDNYLMDQGYEICPEVSNQWLKVRTIVFVANRDVCLALEREKKQR